MYVSCTLLRFWRGNYQFIAKEMNEKTQRIQNFTSSEKEVLMEIIISKYAKILEDKRTNKSTIEKKLQVWAQIEAEFNNKAPIVSYRKQDQLKRLYENKKKELRKKVAAYKNQQYKTGGGSPPEEPKLDKVEVILIKIINEKSVSGSAPGFDCDGDVEPLAKMPRNDYMEFYEFDPEQFGTFCNNEIIDVPLSVKKQSLRCPPYDLQRLLNNKLKMSSDVTFMLEGSRENIRYASSSSSKDNGLSFNEKLDVPLDSKTTFGQIASTSSSVGLSTGSSVNVNNQTPMTSDPNAAETPTKILSSNRRRPMGGVRALTSSDVSEKYNILLDRRLISVNKQIEQITENQNFAKEEQKQKMMLLKLQQETLIMDQEEKKLKLDLLKIELASKKSFLANI